MIDIDVLRKIVVEGLAKYTGIKVVRTNQIAKKPPYPFLSYTIITLANENKGTWGVWDDGFDRKTVKQTWSISALSESTSESMNLAFMAREWIDHVGSVELSDKGITVSTVGAITNRDNIISIEYEYKNGFDVVFCLQDKVKNPIDVIGQIEEVEKAD